MSKDDYFESTAGMLDHFVRNYPADVLLRRLMEERVEKGLLGERKERYCSGLSRVITEGCREYGGITKAHLQEMLILGEKDWEELDTLISLYRRYAALRRGIDEIECRLEE
ncbi:hypothetical protein HYT55_00570 [Candidatus Woesearchaeota archaeon]|nr:hypothetical protein [Candidatus Woesearchaeota archaeon]